MIFFPPSLHKLQLLTPAWALSASPEAPALPWPWPRPAQAHLASPPGCPNLIHCSPNEGLLPQRIPAGSPWWGL